MNFTINQTNGIRETVNSEFINKLYNLFITNRSSHTISLSGYLYSPTGYKAQMDALNSLYGPDLVIEVPEAGLYILIEDPAVLLILINNNISSDGIGISALDASTANLTASMFKNNTNITSFNLFRYFTRANNNPVTELFRGCTNLESVDLSSVIRISTLEFRSSGIKNISAHSLQSLGENAFSYSKVENILDLGLVIEIPLGCFSDCPNLISAVIPETVTSLGGGAFNAYNTSYNKVFTTITGLNNVQNFGARCFCSLTSLNLNGSDINSAVSIKSEAFSNVRLFSGDLNLKNLLLLEHNTFRNTKISKILCLGKIASIPAYAFVSDTSYDFKSSLTEVYLPYECSSIGDLAFHYRTGLTTIKLYTDSVDNWVEGETPTYGDITRVTSFGNSCFYNCTSLTISPSDIANATSIGSNAFNGPSISGAITLNNLTSLGDEVFTSGANITSLDLSGSTITSIGKYICKNSPSLTIVKFPNTLRSFGTKYSPSPFGGCSNITTVTGTKGITTVNNTVGTSSNISNVIPLLSYEIGELFIVSSEGTTNMSVPQVYLPKFKYNSRTWFELWGTVINQTMFTYRSMSAFFSTNVMYFKDLEKILVCMFWGTNITNLVINNATPPAFDTTPVIPSGSTTVLDRNWDTKMFGDISTSTMTIYVPNSAVSTYQADSNYNAYTILGIGSLNSGVIYATEDDWVAANKPNGLIAEYLGLNTADLASFVSANNLTYWTNPNS